MDVKSKTMNMASVLQALENPFSLLPLSIFLFFLYKSLFSKFNHSPKKNLPPSPQKLPILGNLHQIDKYPHRSLHKLSIQYGELMLLHFGSKPVLVVSSSDAACEIMKTHDFIFSDRPQSTIFKRLIYDCKDVAAAPYGDYWRKMRSICVLQLLSNKRVQSFHNVRKEELSRMIEEIRMSSSREVNLSKMFSKLSNDVICRVAFGMKFNGEKYGINFMKLMEKHEELIGGFYVGEFIPWLSWINHVNGVEKEIKRVAKAMDTCLEGIVQEHLDRFCENGSSNQGKDNDEKTKDFVDVLLELQLDRKSIKAIISDMFVAGTTTTYATLDWAMSELLRNPTVMEALKNEVRGITGGNPEAEITDNDLERMNYLKAVIKEALRLHPPVPLLLPRISMQDSKINGYDIASRTQVIINAWAIHRNPGVWKQPEEFNPERFLNSSIDFKGQDFNFIPFGSGRRGCPGTVFAITNIELVLANLMNKFNWGLPEGKSLDMAEYPGLTVHRKMPLLVIATPHSC